MTSKSLFARAVCLANKDHSRFWERDEGKLVNNEQHSKAKEVPGSTA